MNEIEAVTVLAILLDDNLPADRMQMFLVQFPQFRAVAEERWLDTTGNKWED